MPSYGRVAGLKIELEIDGSKVTRYLSTSAREVGKVQSSLKDLEKSLKLNPTNTTLLKQKFELLGKAVESTRKYLADLRNQYERLSAISNPTQKQVEQMRNLQREISDTEVKLKDLSRQFDSFGSVGAQVLKAVGDQVKQFGDKLQSMGSSLSSTGMAIERVTAPIQAAFGFGVKEGMAFESQMSSVQAVTGATAEEMELLETSAREMARVTVFSAEEAGQGLYYMGLSGWQAAEAADALPGVMDLAAAGAVDLGRASSIVVDGMNAMGLKADEATNGIANATHFSNVMAAAMSNSNTTVDLLGESFKYAAPLAGTLGYNIEDLTLGLGLMANAGIKGSQAGTGLRMAFKNMADPTKIAAANAAGFAVSLEDDYGNALPLRDVIEQLRDQFGGLNLELVDAEGNVKTGEQLWEEYGDSLPATQMDKFRAVADLVGVRALPGILGMINASQDDFEQLAGAIDNADGSFVDMYGDIMPLSEAMETFGEEAVLAEGRIVGTAEAMREMQLDNVRGDLIKLKDNFADLGIEVYQEIAPAIRDFISYLSELIDKFRNLDPETKKTILTIAAIVAALGPVLIVIGQVMMGVGAIISVLGTLISGIGSVISIISTVVGVVGALPAIIGAIIVGLLIFIITHWEEFKAAMLEIWTSIKEFAVGLWEGIKNTFSEAAQQIKEKTIEAWNAIKEKAVEIWNTIKDAVVETVTALKDFVVALWYFLKDALIEAVGQIRDKLIELWTKIKTWVVDTATSIRDKVVEAWNNLKDRVVEAVTSARDKLIALWQYIKDQVTFKVNEVKHNIITAWENIKTRVIEVVTGIRDKILAIWQYVKDQVAFKVGAIKDTVISIWENVKSRVSSAVENLKSKITGIWESIKSTTSSVWNTIKNLITNPIETAKNMVTTAINKIKGLFPLSIGNIFKNFKMPHLSWSWKDVGGILKIPSFHVDWYAKAMKNGMLLDGATIFGMNSQGQPMGGGEVGREWIIGENGLMSMIRGAVSQNTLSEDVIFNAVKAGMEAANVNIYMDSQKVTDQVTRQITKGQSAQLRYYGAY